MPTSSYLLPNDYQTQTFKPYELPYSATLQEIATKNAYWEQGAARIKGSLVASMGLDPRYKVGQEYLKNFNDDAQKKLQQVSKSDLSQTDNVSDALNIFKPLYDTSNPFNRALLTDSQLNKFYKEQSSLSDTFRQKDGGDQWNINNDNYFRSAENKYSKDSQNGDYSSIDKHWNNKKSFIPYYNYHKEVSDISKNCHESSFDNTEVSKTSNLLFQTDSNKGVNAENMQGCIEATLSSQAKQQIGIEGYNVYSNNPEALALDWKNKMYDRVKNQADALQAKVDAIKIGAVTKEQQPVLDGHINDLKILRQRQEDGLKQYDDIISKNGFVDNLEHYATIIAVNKFEENAGKALSWTDIKHIMSPNAAGITVYNANAAALRQNADFTHDFLIQEQKYKDAVGLAKINNEASLQQALMTASLKGGKKIQLKADGTYGIVDNGVMIDQKSMDIQGTTYTVNDLKADQDKGLNESTVNLNAVLRYLSGPDYQGSKTADWYKEIMNSKGGKAGVDYLMNFINTYDKLDNKQRDNNLDILFGNLKESVTNTQRFIVRENSANAFVKKNNPEYFNKYDEEKKLGSTIYNGNSISAEDISKGIENGIIKKSIKGDYETMYYNNTPLANRYISSLGNSTGFGIGGIGGGNANNTGDWHYTENSQPLVNMISKISNIRANKDNLITSAKNDYLSDNYLTKKGIMTTGLEGKEIEEKASEAALRMKVDDSLYNFVPTYKGIDGTGYYGVWAKAIKGTPAHPLTHTEITDLSNSIQQAEGQGSTPYIHKIGNTEVLAIPGMYETQGINNPEFIRKRLDLLDLRISNENQLSPGDISSGPYGEINHTNQHGVNTSTQIINQGSRGMAYVLKYYIPGKGYVNYQTRSTPEEIIQFEDQLVPQTNK